ncbi:Protoporphyrinogen oxidase [Paraliobacillus sp. PM-2]|nr:Protoporphyrinogen oxidase [Paraliobacillus sp. PM-2]
MPGGAIMGVPTKMVPFAFSELFSPSGKARAAMDILLPKSKTTGDQSLGQFFRRRLGSEVVENLIEPLLSGIYAGDIDQLSLMSTFPQFYTIEQKYRSLIFGIKKTMPKQPKQQKMAKRTGMFQTLTTGLESLVEAIEEKLDVIKVLKGLKVENINKNEEDSYTLTLSNGEKIEADSVIVSTPHASLPKMFLNYTLFDDFKVMPSTSVATVAMAFPKSSIIKDIDGTGFVVSRNNDYTITACTWTHKKWPHTVPEGYALLRCYVGKAGKEEIVDESDETIKQVVLKDLYKTMAIDAEPYFTVVSRWKNAMPQYTVGHKQRMKTIKLEMEKQLPGVYLAGGSFEGLGIPDCIDQAEKAVSNVLLYLKNI